MARFVARLTKSAVNNLDVLPVETRNSILADIRSLETELDPLGAKTKKLKGFHPPLYRMRSGDHRIIYRFQNETIFVLRVIDRKNLDRIIKRLKF